MNKAPSAVSRWVAHASHFRGGCRLTYSSTNRPSRAAAARSPAINRSQPFNSATGFTTVDEATVGAELAKLFRSEARQQGLKLRQSPLIAEQFELTRGRGAWKSRWILNSHSNGASARWSPCTRRAALRGRCDRGNCSSNLCATRKASAGRCAVNRFDIQKRKMVGFPGSRSAACSCAASDSSSRPRYARKLALVARKSALSGPTFSASPMSSRAFAHITVDEIDELRGANQYVRRVAGELLRHRQICTGSRGLVHHFDHCHWRIWPCARGSDRRMRPHRWDQARSRGCTDPPRAQFPEVPRRHRRRFATRVRPAATDRRPQDFWKAEGPRSA